MDDLLHRTVGEHVEIRKRASLPSVAGLADPTRSRPPSSTSSLTRAMPWPGGGHKSPSRPANTEVATGRSRVLARCLCGPVGDRHRQGIVRRVLAHGLRAFFTTKEVGKGTGLGSVPGLWLRQAIRRSRQGREPPRWRHDRAPLSAAGRGRRRHVRRIPMREQQYRGSECVLVVEDRPRRPRLRRLGAARALAFTCSRRPMATPRSTSGL